MDLELRAVTEDERRAFNRAVATAFGGLPTEAELDWGDEPRGRPHHRRLRRRRDRVDRRRVSRSSSRRRGGARSQTAGVTVVGVRATHRRRGLLTRMMDEQLDDVAPG